MLKEEVADAATPSSGMTLIANYNTLKYKTFVFILIKENFTSAAIHFGIICQ